MLRRTRPARIVQNIKEINNSSSPVDGSKTPRKFNPLTATFEPDTLNSLLSTRANAKRVAKATLKEQLMHIRKGCLKKIVTEDILPNKQEGVKITDTTEIEQIRTKLDAMVKKETRQKLRNTQVSHLGDITKAVLQETQPLTTSSQSYQPERESANEEANFLSAEQEGFMSSLFNGNMTLTDNGSLTNQSSGDALVDAYYALLPGISQQDVHKLLTNSWKKDPNMTLRLIFFVRDVLHGKSERGIFYESMRWLALNHPKTFVQNLKHVPDVGYWKDLSMILQYIRYGGSFRDHRLLMFTAENNGWTDLNNNLAMPPSESELRPWIQMNNTRASQEVIEEFIKEYKQQRGHMNLSPYQQQQLAGVYKLAFDEIVNIFAEQLSKDLKKLNEFEGFIDEQKKILKHAKLTLCGKWAPSTTSSADKMLGLGSAIAHKLYENDNGKRGPNQYVYIAYQQKYLSPLRKSLQVIERFMTAKEWDKIPYDRVPARCMSQKKTLFALHDSQRFNEFLDSQMTLEKPTAIASKTLMPADIVEPFVNELKMEPEAEKTAELQWRSLVEYTKERCPQFQDALPVCDVSGSMTMTINGLGLAPIHHSIALSILLAQINRGIFKDKICAFSEEPNFIDISKSSSLSEKVTTITRSPYNGLNTNFQKVFDQILSTAKQNKLPKDQMVKRVFVFSDMQFDIAEGFRVYRPKTDFQVLQQQFQQEGYELPQLIFWNLKARVDGHQSPITVREGSNAALISGFSSALLKMVSEGGNHESYLMEVVMKSLKQEHYDRLEVVD